MNFRSLFSIDSEMSNADLNSLDQKAHSKAYHRFFAGYTERLEPQANGKSKIVRVYTSFYYTQELPRAGRVGIRLLYLALLLAVIVLFCSNGIVRTGINSAWYVVASQIIFIPLMVWTCISYVNYAAKSKRMTVYEYSSSSVALKNAAMFTSFAAGLQALCGLLYHLTGPSPSPADLTVALKYAVNLVCLLGISLIERRIRYRKDLSEHAGKESGVPILM